MKTILVPTDFSANGNNTLKYAIEFSGQTHSRLVIFYSTYIPVSFPNKEFKRLVTEDEARKQIMLEYIVTEICEKHQLKKPSNISYVSKNGSVVDTILLTAKKYKAELIIIGTHGATGLKRVVFGSNTSDLISRSTIPVLVIPQRYQFKKIKSILYASDMSNLSSEIKILAPIAKAMDTHIEVLYLDYESKGKEAEQRFNAIVKKTAYKKMFFTQKQVSADKSIAEHLKKYTKNHTDSILVMFPKQEYFFEKLFRSSMTKKILFHLNKPLLSIRKPKS